MKAPEAFRGISEVADILGLRQHTLRAWETRFPFVRPVKRPDGRRYYRPADIELLRDLKSLLHDDKRSVQEIMRLHRDGALKGIGDPSDAELPGGPEADRRARLRAARDELAAAGARLAAVLARSGAGGAGAAD